MGYEVNFCQRSDFRIEVFQCVTTQKFHFKLYLFKNSFQDTSDQAKAAEMKMFGKLTRERFEWHPDKTLCKRFNIRDPFPE